MIICNVCKGKKVITEGQETKLCPKCNGKGHETSLKEEQNKKKQVLLD